LRPLRLDDILESSAVPVWSVQMADRKTRFLANLVISLSSCVRVPSVGSSFQVVPETCRNLA
ncbi:hypothetical protein KAX17_12000, partial [Candidatus Bipolaricaulota bacterium]|nr:hypothetical protein [Candidatus Bipolaricaulota bacterium]